MQPQTAPTPPPPLQHIHHMQMSFGPLNGHDVPQQHSQLLHQLETHNLGASPSSNSSCCSSSSSSYSSSSSSSCASNSSNKSSNNSATQTPTIGVNLRVTGQCSQGGRKYMEDYFSVAYQQSENAKDLEYAFIGIYDGHGGAEAATFAKEHLMMEIINQKLFWSDSDYDVLRAIREGYIATHYAMWRDQDKWPKTANGLPSTAGTTATVAFIRREKIYIGHVGDSGIVLGYQNENENFWRAKQLTTDHKPESLEERTRIMRSGGKVVVKSGVPRVVWNRPRNAGHKGPIRRNTPIDEIPFLAVARSLGDLWSYNSARNEFVVSPDPDVKVIKINPKTFRCLIFGTDGLWNVVTPQEAVNTVFEKESINERLHAMQGDSPAEGSQWTNPSKGLVEKALKTWSSKKMRADNTSVVTVILYPPGNANCCHSEQHDADNASYGLEYLQQTAEIPNFDDESTTYHQMAEKYLPPDAYRNFNYYEDEPDGEESRHVNAIKPLTSQQEAEISYWLNLREKYEEKSTTLQHSHHLQQQQQQSHNNTERPKSQHAAAEDDEEEDDEDDEEDEDDEPEDDFEDALTETKVNSSLPLSQYVEYASGDSSNCASSSSGYMHGVSFAESYNTLLSDHISHSSPSNSNSNSTSCQSISGTRMHEIMQEQQLYQQQCMSEEEGYSLTKLETRREQQRCSTGVQTFKIFQQHQETLTDGQHSSTHSAVYQQQNNASSSNNNLSNHDVSLSLSHYWEANGYEDAAATTGFELNTLLQQEREVEQQVELERQIQNSHAGSSTLPNVQNATAAAVLGGCDGETNLEEEYLDDIDMLPIDAGVQIHEISSSGTLEECLVEATAMNEDGEHEAENETVQSNEVIDLNAVIAASSNTTAKSISSKYVEKIEKIEIVGHKTADLIIDCTVLPTAMSTPLQPATLCRSNANSQLHNTKRLTASLKRSYSHYPNIPNENQRRASMNFSAASSSKTQTTACTLKNSRRRLSNYAACLATASTSTASSSNSASSIMCDTRQLRSHNVMDYSKRTLRSRNSLAKDLKAKTSLTSSLKRSTSVAAPLLRNSAQLELLNAASTCHANIKRVSRSEKLMAAAHSTPNRTHAINLRSRLVAAISPTTVASTTPTSNVSSNSSLSNESCARRSSNRAGLSKDSSYSKSTRYQSSMGTALAAPPPSPKLINGAAAVAAATRARSLLSAKNSSVVQAVFNKRSSLRSGTSVAAAVSYAALSNTSSTAACSAATNASSESTSSTSLSMATRSSRVSKRLKR